MSTGSIIGGIAGAVIGFVLGGPVGAVYGAMIGFGIGMAIDPMQPDMPGPGRPETGKFQITTAEEGVPIGDLVGTTKLTGNIFWYAKNRIVEVTETQDPGGKGGPEAQTVVTGYKYYLTWAMGICMGPIDTLYTVYRGDRVVWDGELERPESGGEEMITLEGMGSMTLFFGTDDQVAPSAMTGLLEDPTLSPAYRHLCYAFFNDCYIGDYNRAPQMKFVVKKVPDFAFSALKEIETFQCNPAHALWYVLTQMIGLSSDYLDGDSFQHAAYRLYYEGRGVCILMKQQSEALRYIEAILFHIDGVLRWGVDGKLHLKLIREETNTDDMLLVDPGVTLDDPRLDRKSWLETLNEMKVQYPKLITWERETCDEPAPTISLASCPGLGSGVYTISKGCAPFTIQTSLEDGPWTFQRQVYTRTFHYLCTQYVCSGSPASRKVRAVDANGLASNELDVNIEVRPALVWSEDEEIGPGESAIIGISGGKPPYRFSVTEFGWWFDEAYTKKEIETYEQSVTIYHDGNFCDAAGVLVKDNCNQAVNGWVTVNEGDTFQWDESSSASIISPGGSADVYVTGGVGTFTWSVQGAGFSLAYGASGHPDNPRMNRVECAAGVCGVDADAVATITVTDQCGEEVQGKLRHTGGNWVSVGNACNNPNFQSVSCDGVPVGDKKYRAYITAPFIGYYSCDASCCKEAVANLSGYGFTDNACTFSCQGGPNCWYKTGGDTWLNGGPYRIEEFNWTC